MVSSVHASVRWATLEAIHQIENPQDSTRYGPCGELGAYQFRPETWRMHTREPFVRALDRGASDSVAVRHYEWLKSNLERAGVTATPYMIGLAWNGGLDNALTGRAPRAAHLYAQRVANLTAVLSREAEPVRAEPVLAAAPTPPPPPLFVLVDRAAEPKPLVIAVPTFAAKPLFVPVAAPALPPAPLLAMR